MVGPSGELEPELRALDKGPISVKFSAAEFTWLHRVLSEAHAMDELTLTEAIIIREAVYQLAKRGGWAGELREAVLRRRKFERRRGNQPR